MPSDGSSLSPDAPPPSWIRRAWKAWVLVAAVGVAGLAIPSWFDSKRNQNWLVARSSYNWSHWWHGSQTFSNVVLIEIDPASLDRSTLSVPRTTWLRLLDRIDNTPGVRLVFFDLVFQSLATAEASGTNPPGAESPDSLFASRIRNSDRTIVGAGIWRVPTDAGSIRDGRPGVVDVTVVAINQPHESLLSTNRSNWGIVDVLPDSDFVVRRWFGHFSPDSASRHPDFLTASWCAARLVSPELRGEHRERWLRYYGPPRRTFRHLVLSRVLESPESLQGAEWVFIGVGTEGSLQPRTGFLRDRFRGPWNGEYSGLEIQATGTLNLALGHDLGRLHGAWQFVIALGWSGLLVRIMSWRKSLLTPALMILAALVFALLAMATSLNGHALGWWPWLVPVVLQTSVAVFAAVWLPEPPSGPDRVFLSYCAHGSGEVHARAIHQGLRARGIPAYLAPGRIAGGDSYESALFPVIEKIPNYLLVMTPSARNELERPESWVAREFRHAVDHDRRVLVVRAQGGGPARFDTDDVKHPGAFLRRLHEHADPVSSHFWSRLESETRDSVLRAVQQGERAELALRAVARDVDRILGERPLYDAVIFDRVALSERTRQLVSNAAPRAGFERGNRALILEAFPMELYRPDEFVEDIRSVPGLAGTKAGASFHQVTFDPGQGFPEAMRQIVAGLR